jgi:CRISPR-associated protein Cas1
MNIVLSSYGASLRREDGLFAVTSAEGKQLIPPRDVRSITVSKGARISSDAVLLAIEHEIDVLFVDQVGHPKGRVWSIQYGSISTIRRNQIEFLFSDKSVAWVKQLLADKITAQIGLLLAFQAQLDEVGQRKVQNVINSMDDHRGKIRQLEGAVVADVAPSLRGWEGAATRRYFEALALLVPDEYAFTQRSRMPAQDRFNALLNYGYGILYGRVEGALIKAGLDPYTGIFHRDDYNRPALVYDVIEKYRAWIDYIVLQLCRQQAFSDDCFRQEGEGLWLDGLGKRILIQAVNDYLSEIIDWNSLRRSRAEHIQRQAHELAGLFSQ